MVKERQTDINDNLFQHAVSCPLKLYHHQNAGNSRFGNLPFKHRNKLLLRDVISLRFENVKFTSDDTDAAASETEKWLNDKSVTICGAVLQAGKLLTRVPILVKKGDVFTIAQIHGKLRKRSEPGAISSVPKKRTTSIYLLKAAYRREVLKRIYPNSTVHIDFYFPERGFKAGTDKLLQKVSMIEGEPEADFIEEFNHLFAQVDATKGVEALSESIPESISHKMFSGRSVSEVCDQLQKVDWSLSNQFKVKVHQSCKYCEFRKSENPNETGCWNEFFFDKEIMDPGRHVFELIGHGNEVDSDKGFYYQEQVPYSDQFSSFEIIEKHGGPHITIHQRRILQLLKAKGEKVPRMWAKPILNELDDLKFPLHFIDFEAATYAIPMRRGAGPYSPVYFQFSCHTMDENGEINHEEWLDTKPESGYPHSEFISKLYHIPDITKGTIIQYSQFEQQALRQLNGEFNRNAMYYKNELSMLKELLREKDHETTRFYDLSRLIRDGYFNSDLEGSLGLKQLLKSVLKFKNESDPESSLKAKIFDLEIDLNQKTDGDSLPDPYKLVQDHKYAIDDGATAMNAYIALKSGSLKAEEEQNIPILLRRYCALDSYALIVIFKHLRELAQKMNGQKDLVVFSKTYADKTIVKS